jgi:hypothetical protein
MAQVEENSRQRLQDEKLIRELESELNTLGSQLTVVSNQLELAEQQVDPDYERIEAEIREQLSYEYDRPTDSSGGDPRVNLIRQLTTLDAIELGQIMSVNGQFSPFLQALDVTDERMEVIIGALSNLVAEQNQARQQIMLQAQTQDIGRREMRTQLGAIMSPGAQIEALSYDLTDDELDILRETQTSQRNRRGSFRNLSINSDAGNGTPFYTGPLREQSGSGTARARPIPPSNPRN